MGRGFTRDCTFLACCTSPHFRFGGGIILIGKYKDLLHWLVPMQLVHHLEVQHQKGTVRTACRAVQARKVPLLMGREWRE